MNRKDAAEDLLQTAVFRLVTTKRNWDPAKVDLFGVLLGAMKSILNAATKSGENREISLDEPVRDDPDGQSLLDQVPSDLAGPEEQLAVAAATKEREAAILSAAGDDPLLLSYVEAMMDGLQKPEIAKRMGISIDAVYQTHRKLRRRLEARLKPESAP